MPVRLARNAVVRPEVTLSLHGLVIAREGLGRERKARLRFEIENENEIEIEIEIEGVDDENFKMGLKMSFLLYRTKSVVGSLPFVDIPVL